MDNTLKEIKWEINENTTIPGRIGNNVFQHEHRLACSSKDLMIPLLSKSYFILKDNIILNPYRKFGEMLREKGLEKLMECKGHCVICPNLNTDLISLNCYTTFNKYGCQNCLYFKKNLRDILNLGGEGMLKKMHRRLERLESFRMKGKEGKFLK